MMPSQGNAAQKRWMKTLRTLGMGKIIHHCTDRTMRTKINLVSENIGHWWVIPLHDDEHHAWVHAAGKERKQYEKDRFEAACAVARGAGHELPFSQDVYDAIMEFHK
jgi:hypothetical protein